MGSGWRLPAGEVEEFVASAVQRYLNTHIGYWFAASNDPNLHQAAQEKLKDTSWMFGAIEHAKFGDGVLSINLETERTNDALDIKLTEIDIAKLSFEAPFAKRRRGVETRFVMADQSTQPDQTLIINVAKALAWLDQIKKGASFDEIANSEKTTRKRVQQLMSFVFLAPDFARDILAGKQPIGLTSTWCMTHDLPMCWKEQRALIASL